MERGEIEFRNRKRQILSFKNIRYNNITPTDIDGSMDFQCRAFVFFEVKLGDAPVKFGQRLHLSSIADAICAGNRYAVVFVASHNVENPEEDVDVAECAVREIYFNGEWHTPKQSMTLKNGVDNFLKYVREKEASA